MAVRIDGGSRFWRAFIDNYGAPAVVDTELVQIAAPTPDGCWIWSPGLIQEEVVEEAGRQPEHLCDDRDAFLRVAVQQRRCCDAFLDQSKFPTEVRLVERVS